MKHYNSDDVNIETSKELVEKSPIAITEELNRLANELDTDIRENLPPQMLAVVVGVLKLIEEIEENTNES